MRGWLCAYVLYIEDNPSAFWIGSLYCETFYSEYMAYDPDHVKTAPGIYLAIEVLKYLSSDDARTRAKKRPLVSRVQGPPQ